MSIFFTFWIWNFFSYTNHNQVLLLHLLQVINTVRFYFFTFFCIHLTAMCSACVNPFLYGWLNENISNQVKILKIYYDSDHLYHHHTHAHTPHHQHPHTRHHRAGIDMLARQVLAKKQLHFHLRPTTITSKPLCDTTLIEIHSYMWLAWFDLIKIYIVVHIVTVLLLQETQRKGWKCMNFDKKFNIPIFKENQSQKSIYYVH